MKLTDKLARELSTGTYTDSGLSLRGATLQFTVSPKGRRVFDLLYRNASGKRCRLGVKNFGEHRGEFGPGRIEKVSQARKIAMDAWKRICAGDDPAGARKINKETGTVRDLAEDYCTNRLDGANPGDSICKYVNGIRYSLKDDPIATMLAREVTVKDVEAFLRRRKRSAETWSHAKSGVHAAERTRAQFCTIFRRAGISPNPFEAQEEKINTKAARIARSRSSEQKEMTLEEIAFRTSIFWGEIYGDYYSQDARDLLLCCLLLGNRKSEVIHMRWEQIDRQRQIWIIPPEQPGNKWGVQDTVPLTETIWKMLERRRETANSPWVFPSPSDRRQGLPYNETYLNRIVTASKDNTAICQRYELVSTVHDIRRLMASWCRTQPLHFWAYPFVLNHASKLGSKNDAVYALGDVNESLRKAMQAFENWVRAQAEGGGENVVALNA